MFTRQTGKMAACILLLPLLMPGHCAQRLLVDGMEVPASKTLSGSISDSLSLDDAVGAWVKSRQKEGYLEANVDFQLWNGGAWEAHLHRGQQYWLDSLAITGLPDAWLQRSRLSRFPKKSRPFVSSQVEQRLETALHLAENEGFPFASWEQTTLAFRPGETFTGMSMGYVFRPGPEIRIDSVRFTGKKKEPDAFVRGIIRLQPGDVYNQAAIDAIPSLLNNTLYYEEVKPPVVAFTGDGKAIVTVALKAKQANRFDILAGLLPASPGSNERFQFTVTADVTLVSPTGQGEVLGLVFRKLPGTSQMADVMLRLPYLLRTPLQAEGRLSLQKQEELFQNLSYEAGLVYHLSPYLQASLALEQLDTRLLSEAVLDTAALLPSQLDGNRRLVAGGVRYERIDYRNNPREGFFAMARGGIGRREVRENIQLRVLRPEWYDQVPASQGIQEWELEWRSYWPLGLRQVAFFGGQVYWLDMPQTLRNDQRQLGGVYSLRGFNENQFFTDRFAKLTGEWRVQLERDSYLFGFLDLAIMGDRVRSTSQRALGTGIGMQFGTQVGLFSLVYGVGATEGQPFQPSRGRIHIGLINEW